jgi:hypothetical protein
MYIQKAMEKVALWSIRVTPFRADDGVKALSVERGVTTFRFAHATGRVVQ